MASPADALRPVIHDGPWTLEEVLSLPEDYGQRVELVDGSLVVSPLGALNHQRLVGRVYIAVNAVLPGGLEVLPGANVVLDHKRLLIPDVVVTTAVGATGLCLAAADVLVVGEVVSPSTRAHDLILKRQLYAEAGVPYYLVVDPKGSATSAALFELEDGRYREVARSEDGVLRLERPFPVVLDLT